MADDYWLLVLLAALICASAAGAVAFNKGRSYFGWFFLGLLFGPIAILGIAIASPIKAEPESDTNLPDDIAKLADLHDRGALTDDEFHAAKSRLLT